MVKSKRSNVHFTRRKFTSQSWSWFQWSYFQLHLLQPSTIIYQKQSNSILETIRQVWLEKFSVTMTPIIRTMFGLTIRNTDTTYWTSRCYMNLCFPELHFRNGVLIDFCVNIIPEISEGCPIRSTIMSSTNGYIKCSQQDFRRQLMPSLNIAISKVIKTLSILFTFFSFLYIFLLDGFTLGYWKRATKNGGQHMFRVVLVLSLHNIDLFVSVYYLESHKHPHSIVQICFRLQFLK